MGLAAAAFTTPPDWHFPRAMVAPLIYWILVCSVAGYYAVTWAMRHLPASQVCASIAAACCVLHWVAFAMPACVLGCGPAAASCKLCRCRTCLAAHSWLRSRGLEHSPFVDFATCPTWTVKPKVMSCSCRVPHLSLQVAAFQCLQPFIGTLLAFLVLNESPTPWDLGAVRSACVVVWLSLAGWLRLLEDAYRGCKRGVCQRLPMAASILPRFTVLSCSLARTHPQVGIVAGLLLVTTDRRDLDTQAVFARIKRLVSQRSMAVSKSMRDLTSLARWPGAADD